MVNIKFNFSHFSDDYCSLQLLSSSRSVLGPGQGPGQGPGEGPGQSPGHGQGPSQGP